MKTRRNTGGFTILELALAVAIIGILSGVTAVNVVHYQRTLTQVELDGIAREIFVAAQNHLTMVESQGFMGIDPDSDSDWGNQYVQSDKEKEENGTLDIRYYVVEHIPARNSLNMLNLMLPLASVDETVLQGGSYVIRYQKDPALVLDVFYAVAEKTETGETVNKKFTHTFTETEAEPPEEGVRALADTLWGYSGSAQKGARGQYLGTAIIGWYGVEPEWFSVQSGGTPTPVPKAEKPLSPPTIKIVNAEQLYVEVTNPNTADEFKKAGLRLIVKGEQSGQITQITLRESAETPIDPMKSSFRVVLDDVTNKEKDDNNRNHHFQHVCSGLYPGEDITVYAVAYNNHELTNIEESAHATTNSLFASLEQHPDDFSLVTPATAMISNFRHLENMDSMVSGIQIDHLVGQPRDFYQIPAPADNNSKKPIQITRVEQTSDMDWELFKDAVGEKIIDKNGDDLTANYWPVTNGAGIELYNGNGHKISNVTIDVPGDAGLFATLGHSSSVTDLQLVNFSVNSSGGNAGALAGVLDSSDIGVLNGADVPGVLAYGVNSAVTGKTSVGGLVGQITGACTVKQSAAAVYVTSTSNKGSAGGLIGAIDNESGTQVTVSDSYAGGHTKNNYEKKNGDKVNNGYEGDYYNIEENFNRPGHYNVTATNGNAGGLIGSSTGTSTESLTVENCYATTSVDGGTNAGGLIGDVAGGKIENCYVTGYVKGGNFAGAFAGKAEDLKTKFTNARYLSTVNSVNFLNVGNIQDHPNVSKFDTPTDYNSYAPCTNGAVPYDKPTLSMYYGGKYMFKTISQLHDSGTYTADWMKKHYGDWPMPETQVVNELAS